MFTATLHGALVTVQVRGPVATPTDVRDAALGQALAWIGAHDDGT
ncbi:MAG TPA: hypothetical protein VK923_06145 [Euzebyales bacterium]|nr:hypothetical protein [Euzebyales bacterium]